MNRRKTGYVPIYSSIFLPKIIILTTFAELKIVHNHNVNISQSPDISLVRSVLYVLTNRLEHFGGCVHMSSVEYLKQMKRHLVNINDICTNQWPQ